MEYITADEQLRVDTYFRRLRTKHGDVDAQDAIALEALDEFSGNLNIEVMFGGSLSEKYSEKMIDIYERALGTGANIDEEKRILAYVGYAMMLVQKGDFDRAEEIIEPMPRSETYDGLVAMVRAFRDKKEQG